MEISVEHPGEAVGLPSDRPDARVEADQPGEAPDAGPSTATVDEIEGVLDAVERAIARLGDGSYGTCTDCGGDIDDDRLADQPTAELCGACGIPTA
jgi:RNA polymerase-binding transcription factor DksA